ncbi:MAG: toll/interleukin-1 receptor domain-containing protein [Candidatus Dadabacteria bacterium]|nr:toll/interleukin-1 receptor domain-containing protein [Candidatus Dadabacteria bacterium]
MNIFVSFHEEKSKKIAELICKWLPKVIQSVKPWASFNIGKGKNWMSEVIEGLEKIDFGLICLTPDNLDSTWIHYEAGAFAKKGKSRVFTLLTNLENTDVKLPLSSFQHTISHDKNDMFQLLESINGVNETKLKNNILEDSFETHWVEFEKEISSIIESTGPEDKPQRTDRDILLEILSSVRTNTQFIGFQSDLLKGFRGIGSISFDEPLPDPILAPTSRGGILQNIKYSDITEPKKVKNEEQKSEENNESDITGEHLEE